MWGRTELIRSKSSTRLFCQGLCCFERFARLGSSHDRLGLFVWFAFLSYRRACIIVQSYAISNTDIAPQSKQRRSSNAPVLRWHAAGQSNKSKDGSSCRRTASQSSRRGNCVSQKTRQVLQPRQSVCASHRTASHRAHSQAHVAKLTAIPIQSLTCAKPSKSNAQPSSHLPPSKKLSYPP